MSAPLDVLTVMDAEISYAEDALARRETLAALTRVRDLREARATVAETRRKHAGAIGLLCGISTRIRDQEDRDALDQCVADWCALTGWTWRRTLDRVEVFPPKVTV